MLTTEVLIVAGVVAILVILTLIGLMSRYRRCASDEILVVFGKAGKKTQKMETKVEYNSKLALGDKVTFCLDGEELVGKVSGSDGAYWLCFWNEKQDHEESVNKIFFHFEIPDKYAFRNQIIGRDWERDNGIWPYTSSLEELKKMLDGL